MFRALILATIFLVISERSYCETLNEKVARNAVNCLAGHIASESQKFKSGATSQYIIFAENILGSEKTASEIKNALDKVNTAVRMLGSSKKDEGIFLVSQFCPAIDEIIFK